MAKAPTRSVAELYPPVAQGGGRWSYRPADKVSADQWGWTMNPALAHDDYMCDGCHGHPSRCDCPTGPRFDVVYRTTGAMLSTPSTSPPPSTQRPTPHEDPNVTAAVPFQAPSDQRTTEWSQYPLPPAPPRFTPQFTGNKQYRLPSPDDGLPTAYARATTVADTLDDGYNLERWKQRTKVAAVLKAVDDVLAPYGGLASLLDQGLAQGAQPGHDPAVQKHQQRMHAQLTQLLAFIAAGNDSKANGPIDMLDNITGGRDSAEFGSAVHAWLEALDLRQITLHQIPEQFRPWADAYQRCLARLGLIALPQYVERVVMYEGHWHTEPTTGARTWVPTKEVITGTLDRIYLNVTTGELYLGDLKTSKGLTFSWVTYCVQLNVYGRASRMATVDGTAWEPMPAVNQTMALLVHVPSDDPSKAAVIPYNLATGDRYLATSIDARDHRRNAKNDVPNLATPVPSAAALRFVAAYQALQAAQSVDDLNRIWSEYQDVWTDDLTQLGHAVAPLLTAAA